MCVRPSRTPSACTAAGPSEDLPVARVGELAGEQHRPLDPRVAQQRERRRPVVETTPTPCGRPLHAVERELVADEELLQQTGRVRVGAGWPRASRAARRRRRGGGGLGAAPAGGFATSGNPTAAANANASSGARTSWWRAHGTPAAASTSFIRDLSRTLWVGGGVHARDAQRVARLRERHLQLLQRADETLDRPQPCATARPPRRRSAAGPARRPSRQCAARWRASSGGTCSADAVVTSPSRTPGSWAAVATNRTVAGEQERCDERGVHHGR